MATPGMSGNGEKVNCEAEGEDWATSRAKFSYRFTFIVYDHYNWKENAKYISMVKEFSTAMHKLHRAQEMREFPVRGVAKLKISWMKGERGSWLP